MKNKRRKYALGGSLLELGVGLAYDAYTGMQENNARLRDNRTQKMVENRRMEQIVENQDNSVLNTFPSDGVRSISNFALGGELFPFKGKTGDVNRVKGDSHSQDSDGNGMTGVGVRGRNGEIIAEVEGGEVEFDGKIFSKRLKLPNGKSFADAAMEISKTKAFKDAVAAKKAGEGVVDNPKADIYGKGTATRNIEKNPNPLDALFQMQEVIKSQILQQEQSMDGVPPGDANGGSPAIPTGAFGLDLSEDKLKGVTDILGNSTAFIDNIVNRRLIKNTPDVPAPSLRTAPKLKTDINVQPQLDDISTTTAGIEKGLRTDINNSSIANSNVIAANIQGLRERNRVRGQEINTETELQNQQALLNTQTDNQNLDLLDQFKMQQFQRLGDIRREKSANTANAVEDIRIQQRDKAADKLDRQKLGLIAAQYAESGVLARADLDKIMGEIENGGDLTDIVAMLEEIKKRKGLEVPESVENRRLNPLTQTTESNKLLNPNTLRYNLSNRLTK